MMVLLMTASGFSNSLIGHVMTVDDYKRFRMAVAKRMIVPAGSYSRTTDDGSPLMMFFKHYFCLWMVRIALMTTVRDGQQGLVTLNAA